MSEHREEPFDPARPLETPVTRRTFLALGGLLTAGLAARPLVKAGTSVLPAGAAGRAASAAPAADNKAVARRLLTAFNTGDTRIIDDVVHPRVASRVSQPLNPGRGLSAAPERLKQEIAQIHAIFPDVRFEEESLIAEGDTLVLRWRMSGTHRGGWLGRSATGRRITATGHEVLRVADGRIVEHIDGLADTRLVVLRRLGMLEPATIQQLA